MPQSLTRLSMHLVLGTKNRRAVRLGLIRTGQYGLRPIGMDAFGFLGIPPTVMMAFGHKNNALEFFDIDYLRLAFFG
jgi:hypothetical protein